MRPSRDHPSDAVTVEGHHTGKRGVPTSVTMTIPAELFAVGERGSGPEWYELLFARRAFLKAVSADAVQAVREVTDAAAAEWDRQHPRTYPTPAPVTFPVAPTSWTVTMPNDKYRGSKYVMTDRASREA